MKKVLNAFVWELYKESALGKLVLDHFSSFEKALSHDSYLLEYFGLFSGIDLDAPFETNSACADLIRAAKALAEHNEVSNIKQATELFEKLMQMGLPFQFSDEPEAVIIKNDELFDFIQEVSIGLHLAHPDYFVPYGFKTVFADLVFIGETFNLGLPPIPGKRDVEGRLRYYGQLNSAFYEFRQSYNLSTAEMCAFLYDFAVQFLPRHNDGLPAPSKVWLVTGGIRENGDFDWLEASVEHEEGTAHWQGNLETRRGDVLLMYCVSPHSYIHSIWRASTDGFVDPFFHYHSTIWIEKPIKTVPVTFREMRADPLLSQKGAIKANLQGPSGKPFTLEEYDAVLAIMKRKGQDISQLPRPQRIAFLPSKELLNERNVEVSLVEPLLERLGFTPKDWKRQLPLRMGRGERTYPDYAFGIKEIAGDVSAEAVLETKFTIGSEKTLREAYLQAISYAYRLRSQLVILASREGLWAFPLERGSFSPDTKSIYTWDELQHPDKYAELRSMMVKPRI